MSHLKLLMDSIVNTLGTRNKIADFSSEIATIEGECSKCGALALPTHGQENILVPSELASNIKGAKSILSCF